LTLDEPLRDFRASIEMDRERLGGFVFRKQDDDNYYDIAVVPTRSGTEMLQLRKKVDGKFIVIKTVAPLAFGPSGNSTLEVVADGDSIKVAHNGIIVMDVTDIEFREGSGALFTHYFDEAHFYNVTIDRITHNPILSGLARMNEREA